MHPPLQTAREHLAQAEAQYRSVDGLFHLEEGLALLDDIVATGSAAERAVAANVATTYIGRLCQSIRRTLDAGAVPEPVLEHLFKVMLAFDQTDLAQPDAAREIKIEIARRLVNHYYEGHPAAAKEAALAELMKLTSGSRS